MKYVLLAIFVLIAAQPLQATSCDMHDDQNTSHSQHANMTHDDGPAMDCCDNELADSGDGCSSMSQCGTCPAGLAAVKPSLVSVMFNTASQPYLSASNTLMCRVYSPPFRPPIS